MGGCATKPKVLTDAEDVSAPVAAPETPTKEEISLPAEIETIAAPIVQVEKGVTETLKEEEIIVAGAEEKTPSLGTLFNEKEHNNEANEAATETEIPKEEDKTTSLKEDVAVTKIEGVNTQELVEAVMIKAQAPADDVPADEEKVIQVTPAANAITETEVSTAEQNKTQESK